MLDKKAGRKHAARLAKMNVIEGNVKNRILFLRGIINVTH